MTVNIIIPAKPHIKKYWEKRFGREYKISNDMFFGKLIVNVLDMKIDKPLDIDRKIYSEVIRIKIPKFYFNTKGHSIGHNKIRFLSLLIDKLFYEEMHSFIDVSIALGEISAIQALRIFLAYYGLSEDDCKSESLYRSYQRHCNEKINDKKKILKN